MRLRERVVARPARRYQEVLPCGTSERFSATIEMKTKTVDNTRRQASTYISSTPFTSHCTTHRRTIHRAPCPHINVLAHPQKARSKGGRRPRPFASKLSDISTPLTGCICSCAHIAMAVLRLYDLLAITMLNGQGLRG
jgi:hypothetical protein